MGKVNNRRVVEPRATEITRAGWC